MPQLTPQQIELIEQIKSGTHAIEMPDNPTQGDRLLLETIVEYEHGGRCFKYYTMEYASDVNKENLQIIPLSSFYQP